MPKTNKPFIGTDELFLIEIDCEPHGVDVVGGQGPLTLSECTEEWRGTDGLQAYRVSADRKSIETVTAFIAPQTELEENDESLERHKRSMSDQSRFI